MTSRLTLESLGPAGEKLRNTLGATECDKLLEEAAAAIGVEKPDSPKARYRLAKLLKTKDSPLVRLIGHCIMAQAILHGAREGAGG